MKKYPSSEDLSKATTAAKQREEEAEKLAAAREVVRNAKLDAGLQEIRTDAAGRSLDLHLRDTTFPEEEVPAGGAGQRPPPPAFVAVEPWWNRWGWAPVAGIALLLAIIALVWLALHHHNWSAANAVATRAEATAQKAEAKADRALATGADNTKAIQGLGARVDTVEAKLQDLSVCDPCKRKAEEKPPVRKCNACCTVCGEKKHSHKPKTLKPLAPAAVNPVPPVVQAAPKVDCAPDCVPHAVANTHREEVHPSGLCGIAVVQPDGKSIVAKFVIKDFQGKIQITRVHDFVPDGQMKDFLAKTGGTLSPKLTSWAATGVCDSDQAVVKQNWEAVVKKFNLPNDCKPS
jgi:hypothetical protein